MSWEDRSNHHVSDETLDQREVEAAMLEGDGPSRSGWQRRAVGRSREAALAQVPTVGTLQCQVPIDAWRALNRHIAARDVNQALWLRRAITALFLAEGGDPVAAERIGDMRGDQRRRDVPRDQLGQSRRRAGRNSTW